MTKPTKCMWASEDSDQPGLPPSLIRVFAVRMKKAWVLSYPLSVQRRLRSDWAEAQADLCLSLAHMPFCWFCHVLAYCKRKHILNINSLVHILHVRGTHLMHLTLSMFGKNLSRQHFEIFFFFFPQKTGFGVSCKLFPEEPRKQAWTIHAKYLLRSPQNSLGHLCKMSPKEPRKKA